MSEYLLALIGGALIGLSSVLLLFTHGKIAGISGMIKGSIIDKQSDKGWRAYFILGLVIMGLLLSIQRQEMFPINADLNYWGIALSGFLVGIGTYIGNGCTSGHGICGSSRFSIRSIVATVTFIISGMLIVWVMKNFF
ncbi:MAG: YeeE/YedE family protein [Bdellovibrionales bacterium]|nr:YeeE/YedE family protein [Bdellovibrionales bacterium]